MSCEIRKDSYMVINNILKLLETNKIIFVSYMKGDIRNIAKNLNVSNLIIPEDEFKLDLDKEIKL